MRRFSVITDRCNQDLRCVSVCLRKAIHPTANEPGFRDARQLFINAGDVLAVRRACLLVKMERSTKSGSCQRA